jgi:hypothetical protein
MLGVECSVHRIGLDPFRLAQAVSSGCLHVRQRQCQGVSRVGRRKFAELQHPLHHLCHCRLLRRTVADDGLLHLARGDLVDVQAGFAENGHCRAARLAHDDGRLEVLCVKDSLHHAGRGLMLAQDIAQHLRNLGQATRVRPGGGAGNRAVRQRLRMWLAELDHSIASSSQRRIQPEDDPVRCGRAGGGGLDDRLRAATRSAAHAILHLFELLKRDAHRSDTASGAVDSKAEKDGAQRAKKNSRQGNACRHGR